MKKLFISLATVLVASVCFAQSSMLATLSHDGEISTYYGATALREAYNAATHGDIITLSSGSFVSVDIAKAITIRGAGMEINETVHTEPTVITGDFVINIPDDVTERLTIEGIYSNNELSYKGTLRNATFIKNRFKEVDYYSSTDGRLINATFIHCRIADAFYLANESSASCVNCVLWYPKSNSGTSSNFEFQNCIIKCYDFLSVQSSSYKNCILLTDFSSSQISGSCVAYNCVGNINYLFSNIPNTSNTVKQWTETFKTLTTTNYNDSETFELNDEAKTSLLGLDGTQVGIYGGNMPFNSTPTNPQITKCNVAAKSTADGKLSVDITVNGAE